MSFSLSLMLLASLDVQSRAERTGRVSEPLGPVEWTKTHTGRCGDHSFGIEFEERPQKWSRAGRRTRPSLRISVDGRSVPQESIDKLLEPLVGNDIADATITDCRKMIDGRAHISILFSLYVSIEKDGGRNDVIGIYLDPITPDITLM